MGDPRLGDRSEAPRLSAALSTFSPASGPSAGIPPSLVIWDALRVDIHRSVLFLTARYLLRKSVEDPRPVMPSFLPVQSLGEVMSPAAWSETSCALHYLVKPFTFAALHTRLDSYAALRRTVERVGSGRGIAAQEQVVRIFSALRTTQAPPRVAP
ncbi:hypothetical protein GCM10010383_67410 [Streptomyces lomondensis]|uniref:Uncharacterized protein n=1 Tax=Streptomyces lomondensis TaxID=68229 RepID=A0ABQ2XP63_9ACTN|nr:hypothetical protein GCM10010383_67410 [Streptomyces lomondensis]